MTRRRGETAAAGALVLLAGLGLLDVLMLLPDALAPSVPLPQVWAQVAATGDLLPVLAGPVMWGLTCAAVIASHLIRRHRSSPARVSAATLIEAGLLASAHQGAAFGLNLWLSNHLPPFEGGTTALGCALQLLGPAAIVSGVAILAVLAVQRRPKTSAPA